MCVHFRSAVFQKSSHGLKACTYRIRIPCHRRVRRRSQTLAHFRGILMQHKNRKNIPNQHPRENQPDSPERQQPPRAHRRKRSSRCVYRRCVSNPLRARHVKNPSSHRKAA